MQVHVGGIIELERRGEVRCRVDGCTFPQLPNSHNLCLPHFKAAKKLLTAINLTDAKKAAKNGLNFVYFAQPEGGGPIKIGATKKHPEKRLSSLQTGSPVPLVLISWLPCEWWLEKALHRALDNFRVSGEWFANSVEVRMLAAMAADGLHDKIHTFAEKNGGIKYKKRRAHRFAQNEDFLKESLN